MHKRAVQMQVVQGFRPRLQRLVRWSKWFLSHPGFMSLPEHLFLHVCGTAGVDESCGLAYSSSNADDYQYCSGK